jgi:integrase
MKHRLTPAFVKDPPPPPEGREKVIYWEDSFGLMVTASGHKSFVVQYRAGRVSRRMHFKKGLNLSDARKLAKSVLGSVAKGEDPLTERRRAAAASTTTLRAVTEEFEKKEGGKLRTGQQRQRALERLVLPRFGHRQIDTIKRSEIVRHLDKIEEENGPHMAQATLAFLSRLFNWHASRDDDFLTPIRRGMSRTKMSDYARDRTLSDDELRAVWRAAEATEGFFGYLVRFILLTATRRNEAAGMTRPEMSGSDWLIPAPRMKGKVEHLIPLPKAAKAIVDEMPNIGAYMFSVDGRRPVGNLDPYKARLDKASGVTGWRLHDLRRTARSLMSRAKVLPDIAERCLAHKIGGVRGVYDRYAYRTEKAEAFEALAGLVEMILNPVDKVIQDPMPPASTADQSAALETMA